MKLPSPLKIAALAAACFALSAHALASGDNWRGRASAEEEMTSGGVAAEVALGREISARILGRYKIYDNPALIKYISLVGLSLAKNTSRPELNFHFTVLDSGEVNAYAAPGGYVFVTTGALQMMKDESELAAVLGHEMGHIAEKHVVRQLKIKGGDSSAVSGLAQLVGGSSESARAAFSHAVDEGFDMIFKDSYKREDEMQADRISVILSALSGYDASALARYLERIRPIKERVPDMEHTHPSVDARISQINDVIAKEGIDIGKPAAVRKRFTSAMKVLKSPG